MVERLRQFERPVFGPVRDGRRPGPRPDVRRSGFRAGLHGPGDRRAGHRRSAGHRDRGATPSPGRSRRCAPRPTRRRSSPRRAARPARPRRSAPGARSRPSASSTPWPTTSASASGAGCPSVSVAACAAAPSEPTSSRHARDPSRVPHSRRRFPSAAVVRFGPCSPGSPSAARAWSGEVRAAGPLMAALQAPVTARGPWLTAVLNDGAAHRFTGRPVAVVVEAHRQGRPDAAAFLHAPPPRPGHRRHAARAGRRPSAARRPAGPPPGPGPGAGRPARRRRSAGLLHSLRGPWPLRLAGLPLGDPTARALAARHAGRRHRQRAQPTGSSTTSTPSAPVVRSRDPRELDRWLPALLAREPDRRARDFLRAAARLHAAIGQVELAVVADGRRAPGRAAHPGRRRRPAGPGGASATAALRTELGSPAVSLTAPGPATGRRCRGSGAGAQHADAGLVDRRHASAPQLQHTLGRPPAARGPAVRRRGA